MTKKDMDQLEEWRARLWKMARKAAKGQEGPAVVGALRRATKRLNKIGMDRLYDEISNADSTAGLYYAFDIMWLAVFEVELERQASKRASGFFGQKVHLPKKER